MSIKIIGTGHSVPKTVLTNEMLTKMVDTSDEWITSRTGIKSRFVCADETLTDLCVNAASQAISKANITIDEIDLLICSTISGDYTTPSLACAVAERMQTNCPAFDVNAACSGFVYALDVASSYIGSKKAKNVLIICAEMMSKHIDWTDRNTCVLFGDAAGACVVTQGNALKYIHLTANGNTELICLRTGTGNSPFVCEKKQNEYMYMNGQEVFKFAVNMIEIEMKKAFEKLKISDKDIDLFLLHQANKRIIDFARTRLNQPEEKFPVNIDRYGNTSAASIPILLNELIEDGKIKKGDTIYMTAFGAGLTTGTCVLKWE